MTAIARILSLAFFGLALCIAAVALIPLAIAFTLDPTDRAEPPEDEGEIMTKKKIEALRARAFAVLDWFTSKNPDAKDFYPFTDSVIAYVAGRNPGEYPGVRCSLDGTVLFRGHDVSRWPAVAAICAKCPIEVAP